MEIPNSCHAALVNDSPFTQAANNNRQKWQLEKSRTSTKDPEILLRIWWKPNQS